MGQLAEFGSMNLLHWGLVPTISQAAGAVLFAAIWQSAVVAACLALCLRLVPRANAAHRFVIWGSGFGVALLLPFLPLFSRFAAQSGLLASMTPEKVRPLVHVDLRWSIAVTAIWSICSLYRASDLAIHSVRLRKLWKSAKPVEVETSYAAMLTIPWRKRVEICTTKELERPSVLGFLAPRILIPEWLFARLTPGELDQIVLHETEHLRRGDDWTNLLQKISLILFPLNPVLLWMERRLCLEREMACDEGVVRVTGAPRAYAACLTSLAERGIQHRSEALSLGIWQRRPELVRRVHGILARRTALGPIGARSTMVVLGCGLLFGTAELSRCPQLIAFTSASELETAQLPLRSAGDVSASRMENVAYFPDRDSGRNPERFASGRGRLYGAPHMTEIKAIMPVHRGTHVAGKSTAPRAVLTRETVNAANVSPKLTAYDQQQQEAKAHETIANADGAAAAPLGWIVLTTWEVVRQPSETVSDQVSDTVSGQASDLASDLAAFYEPSDDRAVNPETNADPADSSAEQSHAGSLRPDANPSRGQVRVTQLVFRVLPSQNGSAAEAPIRASWLVIQL